MDILIKILEALLAFLKRRPPPPNTAPNIEPEAPNTSFVDVLVQVYNCSLTRAQHFAPHLVAAMARFEINTHLRQAHFLAQIGHESGGLSRLVENLNYSVDGLLKTFGRHRISAEDAQKYGRSATQQANKPAIANRVYGGEWGAKNLGNTEPGDGWRFIGRGLIQTTGRANYAKLGHRYVDKPELLEEPEAACMSAAEFWHRNGCNALADADDVVAVTKRVNGGTNGLAERTELLEKARKVLGC